MNCFSLRRYGLLMKKQLIETRRRQLLFTIVLTLILFMTFWLVNWMSGLDASLYGSDESLSMARAAFAVTKFAIFISITCLAIGYNSAHSMPFMRTRQRQTAYMTLPASMGEKYAVIQTHAFLLSLIEALIAGAVADGLQQAVTGISTIADLSHINWASLIASGMPVEFEGIFRLGLWSMAASVLLYSAWFTFAATLFRKHPFLFGLLIIWGVQQIFSTVLFAETGMMQTMMETIGQTMEQFTSSEIFGSLHRIGLASIIGQAALALILWVWSYIRLKRAQL